MAITDWRLSAGSRDSQGATAVDAARSQTGSYSARQERLRREFMRRGSKGFVVVKSPEAVERPGTGSKRPGKTG